MLVSNKNKTTTLPTDTIANDIPNTFFIEKIDKIRDELDLSTQSPSFKKYIGPVLKLFTIEKKNAQLRPSINEHAAEKLVFCFVMSRIDYAIHYWKVQLVQNLAARLVKNASKTLNVSLLFSLQWLPDDKCTLYKIAISTYNCIYGENSPKYLKDLINAAQNLLVAPKKKCAT